MSKNFRKGLVTCEEISQNSYDLDGVFVAINAHYYTILLEKGVSPAAR